MGYVDRPTKMLLKIFWILLVILRTTNTLSGSELPCAFSDSINITNGVHHSNRSITFGDIAYHSGDYAQINYDVINGTKMLVKPYFRGCFCKVAPCVRMCCPFGTFAKFEEERLESCDKNKEANIFEIEMLNKTKHAINVSSSQLSYVDGLCHHAHHFVDSIPVYDVSEDTY